QVRFRAVSQRTKGRHGVGGLDDVVAGAPERLGDRPADQRLVVDYEYVQGPGGSVHDRLPLTRSEPAGSDGGQLHGDGRPAPRRTIDIDRAAVRLDEASGGRQPETGAARLRREERREDFLSNVRRNPGA